MPPLTLLASHLIDGTGSPPLQDAFIRIEDGAISAVGRRSELGSAADDARNLGDVTILPGLINMHTHLTLSAGEQVLHDALNDSYEAKLMRGVEHARQAIETGVTTIRDCGTSNPIVFALREASEVGLIKGPHIWASGEVLTSTGGHCYFFGVECDCETDVKKAVRRQVKAGADFIKVMATGGRLTPNSFPEHPQFTRDELIAIREDATRLGRLVSAHCLGTPGVANAVEARVQTIEHCAFLTPTGVEHDDQLATQIAERDIFVCPTMGAGERRRRKMEREGALSDQERALRDKRLESIVRMRELGVKIVSGNDAGVPLTRFDDFQLDIEALVEQIGMSTVEAIHTATGQAAAAIGSDEFGTFAPGKRADVLVVAGDAATDIHVLRDTKMVLKSGDVMVDRVQGHV